jgi:hypothetical protein
MGDFPDSGLHHPAPIRARRVGTGTTAMIARGDRASRAQVRRRPRLTGVASGRRSGEAPSRQTAMRPTTKRATRIAGIAVVVVAAVGALLWFLLDDPASRGPLIRGKPVTYWTRQLSPVPRNPEVITYLANERSVAIPALVQQLSLPDVATKDFTKKLWRRLPAPLRARARRIKRGQSNRPVMNRCLSRLTVLDGLSFVHGCA